VTLLPVLLTPMPHPGGGINVLPSKSGFCKLIWRSPRVEMLKAGEVIVLPAVTAPVKVPVEAERGPVLTDPGLKLPVTLRFVNFHTSGTSLEAAALFAVKESSVLTFPSAIVSLWTEVALCVQAQAGPAVATRGRSRRLGSYCSIVGLGMLISPQQYRHI
jgi:hypothetical protein